MNSLKSLLQRRKKTWLMYLFMVLYSFQDPTKTRKPGTTFRFIKCLHTLSARRERRRKKKRGIDLRRNSGVTKAMAGGARRLSCWIDCCECTEEM